MEWIELSIDQTNEVNSVQTEPALVTFPYCSLWEGPFSLRFNDRADADEYMAAFRSQVNVYRIAFYIDPVEPDPKTIDLLLANSHWKKVRDVVWKGPIGLSRERGLFTNIGGQLVGVDDILLINKNWAHVDGDFAGNDFPETTWHQKYGLYKNYVWQCSGEFISQAGHEMLKTG